MPSPPEVPVPLGLVLYWLYHIRLRDFSGFSKERVAGIRRGVMLGNFPNFTEALTWAIDHPETDFAALVPGLKYSNNQIYEYLEIIYRQLVKEEEEVEN